MLYSITVDLGDPQGDNDALMEALDIIRAKPLVKLKKRKQWLASTPYPRTAIRRLHIERTVRAPSARRHQRIRPVNEDQIAFGGVACKSYVTKLPSPWMVISNRPS